MTLMWPLGDPAFSYNNIILIKLLLRVGDTFFLLLNLLGDIG